MIIPIVCYTPDCSNRGKAINEVCGVLPDDLDDFFMGYDEDCPEDWCPLCNMLGIAQDPLVEHVWENRYFEPGHDAHLPVASAK